MAEPVFLPVADLDGRAVDPAEVQLAALRQDFMVGQGLFETIKVREGQLAFLHDHLARMERGSRALGLQMPSFDLIHARARAVIRANSLVAGSLKVILCAENGDAALLILARDRVYAPEVYERGFSVGLIEDCRRESDALRFKTLDYAANLGALAAARTAGRDEAVFCGPEGQVREGTISNVFWVEGEAVVTPSTRNLLLPGIARAHVVNLLGRRVREIDFLSSERLLAAEEVFVTNVLMGVMPVSKIGDKVLPVLAEGATARLRCEYEALERRSLD